MNIPCPVSECKTMIQELFKVSYKPPEIWFKHIWISHKLSPEYIEAQFICRSCPEVFNINCAVVGLHKLKDILGSHMTSLHKELLPQHFRLGGQWNEYYSRQIILKADIFKKVPKINMYSYSIQDYFTKISQSKEKIKCSICSKAFIKAGNLNNHLKCHEKESIESENGIKFESKIYEIYSQIKDKLKSESCNDYIYFKENVQGTSEQMDKEDNLTKYSKDWKVTNN